MKWLAVKLYAMLKRKTVVDLFGGTYVVSGNYIKRIR